MSIELYHTASCELWASKNQATLYLFLKPISKEYPLFSRSIVFGLGVGIASSAIATAGRVGRIGEIILKAICNISGFATNSDRLKGFKQLFFQLPSSILHLIRSPIFVAGNLIFDTLGFTLHPAGYSIWKKQNHLDEAILFNNLTSLNTKFQSDPKVAKLCPSYR